MTRKHHSPGDFARQWQKIYAGTRSYTLPSEMDCWKRNGANPEMSRLYPELQVPRCSNCIVLLIVSSRRRAYPAASSSQLGLLLRMSLLSELEVLTGSTLRWKNWDTKYGVSGFQLVPSEPHTRESGCGLWATPRASDKENRTTKPTPAQLAGKHGAYLAVQVLWSTSTATEHKREISPGTISRKSPPLATQVQWPTPTATEYGSNQGGAAGRTGQHTRPSISRLVQGSNNTTGNSPERLNFRWVLSLMGYPNTWLNGD